MLDCLIMGDSIAVGIQHYKPQCHSYTKSGITSSHFNKQYVDNRKHDFESEVVIISLGSNDASIKTYNELYKLRERVNAKRVYWVLPNPETFPRQSDDVKLVAISFGDFVISTSHYQKDRIHPDSAGYKDLVREAE